MKTIQLTALALLIGLTACNPSPSSVQEEGETELQEEPSGNSNAPADSTESTENEADEQQEPQDNTTTENTTPDNTEQTSPVVIDEEADNDGDGYVMSVDCDDTNTAVNPGATEQCDGIDNDCDGTTDPGVRTLFYRDNDGDGVAGTNTTDTVYSCSGAPQGYVSDHNDCNDTDGRISPKLSETCDGIDNNCDGQADENLTLYTYYADADHDGYGSNRSHVILTTCESTTPNGYSANNTDCDDSSARNSPIAAEICDDADNNCDGNTDENLPQYTFAPDSDGDGIGNRLSSTFVSSCHSTAETGYVSTSLGSDCDDDNSILDQNNNTLNLMSCPDLGAVETTTSTLTHPCAGLLNPQTDTIHSVSIAMTSEDTGYAACNGTDAQGNRQYGLYKTVDGGVNWTEQRSGFSYTVTYGNGYNSQNLTTVSGTGFISDVMVNDIDVDSNGDVYFCGQYDPAAPNQNILHHGKLIKYDSSQNTLSLIHGNESHSLQNGNYGTVMSCDNVEVSNDGTKIAIMDVTRYDHAMYSEDSGATWYEVGSASNQNASRLSGVFAIDITSDILFSFIENDTGALDSVYQNGDAQALFEADAEITGADSIWTSEIYTNSSGDVLMDTITTQQSDTIRKYTLKLNSNGVFEMNSETNYSVAITSLVTNSGTYQSYTYRLDALECNGDGSLCLATAYIANQTQGGFEQVLMFGDSTSNLWSTLLHDDLPSSVQHPLRDISFVGNKVYIIGDDTLISAEIEN